ncbi:hypothetical protein A3K32_06245 [candidate division WOR-1 bacterium RIFOXYB2_FULL_45_9]|nr:MAG: hypothetical protein A3K32_06245 [candidate division WOR-1 bacterium RIFOXYB2_FULL_45_9]OGC30996.1 MAG: hypothetical protein A2346_06370 [candidate division WOR-1 bacterium RIFOXYB12_FULL_52_16]
MKIMDVPNLLRYCRVRVRTADLLPRSGKLKLSNEARQELLGRRRGIDLCYLYHLFKGGSPAAVPPVAGSEYRWGELPVIMKESGAEKISAISVERSGGKALDNRVSLSEVFAATDISIPKSVEITAEKLVELYRGLEGSGIRGRNSRRVLIDSLDLEGRRSLYGSLKPTEAISLFYELVDRGGKTELYREISREGRAQLFGQMKEAQERERLVRPLSDDDLLGLYGSLEKMKKYTLFIAGDDRQRLVLFRRLAPAGRRGLVANLVEKFRRDKFFAALSDSERRLFIEMMPLEGLRHFAIDLQKIEPEIYREVALPRITGVETSSNAMEAVRPIRIETYPNGNLMVVSVPDGPSNVVRIIERDHLN